jgi:hypothetical protein
LTLRRRAADAPICGPVARNATRSSHSTRMRRARSGTPASRGPVPADRALARGCGICGGCRARRLETCAAAVCRTSARHAEGEGPSVAPRPAEARGCPLAGAALSLSCPMRQRTVADRVWDTRLRTRVFGALPSMKRLQGWGARRTRVGSDAQGTSSGPARATRRLGRTRRAALISASALRVGVGLTGPGWLYNASAPFGSGSRRRRWTATTARGVAATASRTGWRARVRRVGRSPGWPGLGKGTRRRCTRTTRTREGAAASGLANGNAPRHGACPNLGRRVALNEVGVMLRGRGSERRP